jgi:ubiquinone/menaquinone biosynthesis C-methylase UbiE
MKLPYASEPEDKAKFTQDYDRFYTRFAGIYNVIVKVLPVWKRWIGQATPYIQGPRVLEVSFGTGYLLAQYASQYETYGIDYNERMVNVARKNLADKGIMADLRQGNVEALPYGDEYFDTVVNTMAFTGYPDGGKAMSEIHRVLKRGGRLVMVDINYPADGNRLGMMIAQIWSAVGDLLRDMDELFQQFGFEYSDEEIGGFGSVHLYVAQKSPW